jgi:AcrR family transcriptional regulator
MPYPTQINREQIIQQAATMIAADGADAFSFNKLAASLGVKTPSLYRHVGGKGQLLQAVNLDTLARLFAAMETVQAEVVGTPQEKLSALLNAYRAFAHTNPRLYLLIYHENDEYRPDENMLTQLVLPIQASMVAISGEERALAALRGAMALVHGFVMLEINNQLRRGGSLDEAFQLSIEAFLRGW